MNEMAGRVLAVDLGEKNIGLAISDPTQTIANPLAVIKHSSRLIDAASIAEQARQNQVVLIVIGQPLNADGSIGSGARHSARMAEAVREQTDIPVVLWDESGSTQEARYARIQMGGSRAKRSGHLDELAATVILQSYLDAQRLR